MKLIPKITIADYFGVIEEPRIDRTKRHKLIDRPATNFNRLTNSLMLEIVGLATLTIDAVTLTIDSVMLQLRRAY